MIINCAKCNKKFEVESSLIPDDGRLLECSSCNHKWFFKKEIIKKPSNTSKTDLSINKNVKTNIEISQETPTVQDNKLPEDFNHSKQIDKNVNLEKNRKIKKINIFYLLLVFIISFVAVILILDTFKTPIRKIFPNIEFILYNLYESVKDIKLFFKDLT
jgi:predicted Zn finger-like uncharacterized protein